MHVVHDDLLPLFATLQEMHGRECSSCGRGGKGAGDEKDLKDPLQQLMYALTLLVQ